MRLHGWANTYDPSTQATPTSGTLPSSYDIKLPQYASVSDLPSFDFEIPSIKTANGYKRDTNSKLIQRPILVNHSGAWIFANEADVIKAVDLCLTYKGLGGTLVYLGLGTASSTYFLIPTAILKTCRITRKSQVDTNNWKIEAQFVFQLETFNWTTNASPPTGGFPDSIT